MSHSQEMIWLKRFRRHAAKKLARSSRSNSVLVFRVDKLKKEEKTSTRASFYIKRAGIPSNNRCVFPQLKRSGF